MFPDPTLPTRPPPYVGKCSLDGYLAYREDCFKINTKKLGFADATLACSDEGAALATIVDGYAEAFVIFNMLNQQESTLDSIWIGLSADDVSISIITSTVTCSKHPWLHTGNKLGLYIHFRFCPV